MSHQGQGINVPTGQFFAGGQARGQLARGQLDVQQGQLGVQQESLDLAQQKQQDLVTKQIGDAAKANFKALEEELGGIGEQLEILRAQPDSPQKEQSIQSLLDIASSISGKTIENLDLTAANTGTSFDFEKARIQRQLAKLQAGPVVSAGQRAEFAGKVTGAGAGAAKVAEAAVTGVPLVEDKPLNTASLNAAMKLRRTGETIDPVVFGADVARTVNALTPEQAVTASVQAQATGAPEDFFVGQQKAEAKEFRDQARDSLNALSSIQRIREIMQQDDFVSGLTGSIIQTIQSIEGNVRQAVKATGGEIEGNPFDVSKYDLSGFGEFAAASQAFKTNVVGLAIQIARAAEPGGKLSDKDVQLQLNRLAANSGDPNQILAALDEVDRSIVTSLKNSSIVLKLKPEQIPQEIQNLFSGLGQTTISDIPGLSPEDITALKKRAAELRAKKEQ